MIDGKVELRRELVESLDNSIIGLEEVLREQSVEGLYFEKIGFWKEDL